MYRLQQVSDVGGGSTRYDVFGEAPDYDKMYSLIRSASDTKSAIDTLKNSGYSAENIVDYFGTRLGINVSPGSPVYEDMVAAFGPPNAQGQFGGGTVINLGDTGATGGLGGATAIVGGSPTGGGTLGSQGSAVDLAPVFDALGIPGFTLSSSNNIGTDSSGNLYSVINKSDGSATIVDLNDETFQVELTPEQNNALKQKDIAKNITTAQFAKQLPYNEFTQSFPYVDEFNNVKYATKQDLNTDPNLKWLKEIYFPEPITIDTSFNVDDPNKPKVTGPQATGGGTPGGGLSQVTGSTSQDTSGGALSQITGGTPGGGAPGGGLSQVAGGDTSGGDTSGGDASGGGTPQGGLSQVVS